MKAGDQITYQEKKWTVSDVGAHYITLIRPGSVTKVTKRQIQNNG